MLIREATDSDATEIARLSTQLGYPSQADAIRDRIEKTANHPDYFLIVCEKGSDDRTLSGWLQAHASDVIESGFRVEIVGLIVEEDARRSGVGRKLVAQAEQWATNIGAETINVRSNVQRQEAHLFYANLGFEMTKTQSVYRKVLKQK